MKFIICLIVALVGLWLVFIGCWPIGAIMIIAGAEYSHPNNGKGSSHE